MSFIIMSSFIISGFKDGLLASGLWALSAVFVCCGFWKTKIGLFSAIGVGCC
jgi:hypothetical protein